MDIRFKFLDNCSLIINIWNCDILEKYEKSAYRNFFQYRRKICLKISLEILKSGNIVHQFPKFDQLVPMYFMKKQANKGTTTTWLAKSPPHHHFSTV